MIEGTPARNVLKIDKVYSGYWYLNVFEEQVAPISIDLDPSATQWKIKKMHIKNVLTFSQSIGIYPN